jgi:hypothetical protein
MVRELDFSKITIRILEHIDKKGENDEDHVIAKLTGNTLDTLRRCLVRWNKAASILTGLTHDSIPQRNSS